VLFDQFRYFFNFFFLLITLSQFVPMFKVGFLFSYVAPLVFVLTLTMLKEALDDFKRFRRDSQANSYRYTLQSGKSVKSHALRVGDLVTVKANERVPADLVLLSTSESNGCVFIRTDQLDGETDWKLRHAVKPGRGYEF
jgi:phospholipid-translocating ATPase